MGKRHETKGLARHHREASSSGRMRSRMTLSKGYHLHGSLVPEVLCAACGFDTLSVTHQIRCLGRPQP